MKPILLLLSLTLILIFVLSIFNVYRIINAGEVIIDISTTSTEAFDPALSQVPGFEEIESRMSAMIQFFKKTENTLRIWNIVLNLLVTIATGLTALITSISTAKNNTLTKNAAITVAIITFVASLISFGQSQLTTEKENITKKVEEVKSAREELESLKPDELINQLPVYNRRLDEI